MENLRLSIKVYKVYTFIENVFNNSLIVSTTIVILAISLATGISPT